MTDIYKRTLTGTLLLVLVIGTAVFNSIAFVSLFFFIMLGSLFEFYRISNHFKVHPQTVMGMLLAAFLYIYFFLNSIGFISLRFIWLLLPLMSLVFINELFFHENRPFHNIAFTFLGIFYVAFPFALFNYLLFSTSSEIAVEFSGEKDIVNFIFQPPNLVLYNYQLLLGIFSLHWISDSGAYIIGVPFGKHKLWKRISPKKSWEGLFGGAFFALITAFLLARYFPVLNLTEWLIIAFIVIVFGTFGDLIESLLKRSAGMKDSGTILPGHGGFLDRYDGVIFSLPVIYAFLQMIS